MSASQLITRTVAALLLLAGLAAAQPAPGLGGVPELQGVARRGPVSMAPDDPATDQAVDCYYWGYYIWNNGNGAGPVEGRIYWPNACDSTQAPPGKHPLVLLIHGDGHAYTDYHYLVRHLALNGFIVATINGGNLLSNEDRALRMRTYLDFVRNHWAYQAHVQDNVGLIGHSRGGEAVLTAARLFGVTGAWAGDGVDVNAVISLAPTDQGGEQGQHESLDGYGSPAYLVVTASRDEDVYGYCTDGTIGGCGAIPTGPQATGFALYDRAGSEGNTEPFPLVGDVVTKSLLFVDKATHNRWREVACGGLGGFIPKLKCSTHQAIAKGYFNAFLRWHLKGQDQYRPFFTGEWMPASVSAEEPVTIRTQFSEGYDRRVVDNMENVSWQAGLLGAVEKELQVGLSHYGPGWQAGDFSVPHDTGLMHLRWTSHPLLIKPWIRWDIVDGIDHMGRRMRDVTGFDVLSFRAGRLAGSELNPADQPTNFFVRLTDKDGASRELNVAAFAQILEPDAGTIVPALFPATTGDTPKSAMVSVRLPLSLYAGHVDLENVASITFRFADTPSGELLVDSLEFAH